MTSEPRSVLLRQSAPYGPRADSGARLMLLQAALNGPLTNSEHGSVPVTMEELVVDAAQRVAAGGRAFSVHTRDDSGKESIDARVVTGW
jgi:uncharacterized protein (DUF849 family)